jgi:long-chain acyl-CoA synthetase
MQPRRETLLDLLGDFFAKDGVFLIHDDGYRIRRRTFRDVACAAHALAARFQAAGIVKSDKIILWGENRPEWVVALYACLLTGAVAVPVDYHSSADFVARVAALTAAKLTLQGDETAPLPKAWPLSQIGWPDHLTTFQPPPLTRDDLCQIIFTSGATADPKGVTITHSNLLANLKPVEQEIGKYQHYARPFQPLRIVNLLPLSHLFGQVMTAFIPPMIPLQVVSMRSFDPAAILRTAKKQCASVIVSVPMILDVLRTYVLEAIQRAGLTAPVEARWYKRWWIYRHLHRAFGWKFWAFIAGAAPLSSELENFWSERGYLVVQGYGLTETAPIVTVNHPFHAAAGSVGRPIAGIEVQIAPDGEILVRGENVTRGYFNASESASSPNGWLHTGDIGSLDERGNLHIRGRKKEMIVTPEGLNVFPEDIEGELSREPGVRESAIVGDHRPHAVLVLDPGANPDPAAIVARVNSRLEPHQQIRGWTVWPDRQLPRTEGLAKLKRSEIQTRVSTNTAPQASSASTLETLLSNFAHRPVTSNTTLAELGLSSLERIELLTRLESKGTPISESALAQAKTIADLERAVSSQSEPEPVTFPAWNRTLLPRILRRLSLPFFLLPLARVFAHIKVYGRENLAGAQGPVLFAANHQSHMDLPVILAALPARFRYRLATAMLREFFRAWFHPEHARSLGQRLHFGLLYYLATLLFAGFPLPQREAGTRQALRYMGELASDGWSVLIFPEGIITDTGAIGPFQPGVGLIAVKANLPVVPVRLTGLDHVLHRTARFPTPGPVQVRFGKPMTFTGEDYAAIAGQIERALRDL